MTSFTSREAITTTNLTEYYKRIAEGKVRDLYELDEETLLFVATDRISAYDVVLENGVPGKGALLTTLSAHWFSVLPPLVPGLKTHFLTLDLPEKLAKSEQAKDYDGRSMQVRKLEVLPIESIVRGYITGSAWSEYQKSGTVHGMEVAKGLRESEAFPEPIWTPSTKAEQGQHDENISPAQAAEVLGSTELAEKISELSIKIFKAGREYAYERGIIIADTKFEFGLDKSTTPPTVILIDEVLTPDSSRFWDKEKYEVGRAQGSLDKQYLRDWLTSSGLKGKDGVAMTEEVAKKTAEGYAEAYERLTGKKWV